MALGDAIARGGVAEFAIIGVWTAVVVDIDEVEGDDPRARAEDHRCLLGEESVDDCFELIRWDGMKLGERVVVGIRPESAVSDLLDGFLIGSGLEERLPDDPGVEAIAFDSGDRDFREEIKR